MGDGGKRRDWREEEALWRYGLIREAADERLTPGVRGRLVRALAGRPVKHPLGELRAPARSTLDDRIRAYRRGGFEALKPAERAPGPRTPAPLLEQAAALRRELPARTGAQIAEILRRLHGERAPSARTVERYLRRRGLSRARLQGRERAFGRFEASAPNELWVADVLHGPLLGGRRAYLFCVLDDHSRFVVAARFAFAETTLALEGVLRTGFLALGLPDRLYVDNGSPFASAQLQRICAVLAIKLVHSSPGKPQGRGKLERFFRTVRERFLVELERELNSLDELNRSFKPGCSRPTTAAFTPRRARRRLPATPPRRRGARTPATIPSFCARRSSGPRRAPSRRPRPSRCTATATRSTPPWSAAASICSTTPSTSPGSRSNTRIGPSGSPSRTRSAATPTRPRRTSPRPSRRRRPASTTCTCSPKSTSGHSAARSTTATSPPASPTPRARRRKRRDAQPAQALLRLHAPALQPADPRPGALPLTDPPRGARPHRLRDRAGGARPPHRRGRLRQDRRRPRRRRHPRRLPLHAHLPRQPLDALIPQTHELLAHERAERGKRVVVVIDEAHLLSPGQLDEIRLLTNAEMDSQSPFAGILLGQPSLRLRLGSFAALDQRLALRYQLPGMSPEETTGYLRHHLTLAGRDDTLFSDDAVALLHRASRGIPRALNNLAIQALVAAYPEKKAIVDESSARAAVTEITTE